MRKHNFVVTLHGCVIRCDEKEILREMIMLLEQTVRRGEKIIPAKIIRGIKTKATSKSWYPCPTHGLSI